jgi:transposase
VGKWTVMVSLGTKDPDEARRLHPEAIREIEEWLAALEASPKALSEREAHELASPGGAEHWAVIASLIETCKLAGVEPRAYLADVLTRIVEGHLNSRLDDLVPWAYPAMPTAKAVA